MIASNKLIDTMLLTIRRFRMPETGDKVIVAVSGGPDSVALLHALYSLREELGITLHVAHLNHSFRGEESDEDAEYVRALADGFGLAHTIEKIDVPQIAKTLRLSDEEAARAVRYDFLERVASDVGADRIAVGHTADDQVETVLLNFLRGSGIDGLSGMPPVRGKIIRPLIGVRRSEVEEYVHLHGLHPRIDASNLLATYTRNRVRLELLPLLRREYNPDVDSAILRLAELSREDSAYLSMESDQALRRITVGREDGSLSLDANELLPYPLAVRRRVIRDAVRTVRGELTDIGFAHVEELLRLVEAGADFEYELPGGTFIQRAREILTFLSCRPSELPIIYCYELAIPGKTDIPEIQAAVEAEISRTPVDPVRPPGSLEVVIDYGSVAGKLRARNWEPGDRIRPLGLGGSKKVQDIFVDGKIPRAARHRVPLIADDEKIVWIAGLTLSEEAKVTDSTREFLILKIL